MATSPSDIVEAIDAAILAMMNGGGAQMIKYPDGREVTYANLTTLRSAREHYAALADSNAPRSLRISPIKFGGTT